MGEWGSGRGGDGETRRQQRKFTFPLVLLVPQSLIPTFLKLQSALVQRHCPSFLKCVQQRQKGQLLDRE